MPREYLDLAMFLRRLALRLRACPTPDDVLDLDKKDQPYSNIELADRCERVAQDREDAALTAQRMIRSGAALTPEQMVETALLLVNVEANADVSVSAGFIIGLAEIAEHAIEKHHAARRVA